jgi:hypothetical protein
MVGMSSSRKKVVLAHSTLRFCTHYKQMRRCRHAALEAGAEAVRRHPCEGGARWTPGLRSQLGPDTDVLQILLIAAVVDFVIALSDGESFLR